MEKILFALPGNELLVQKLAAHTGAEIGKAEIRRFPDGESFIRIDSEVKDKKVVMVCTLDRPDEKLLPLFFLSQTAKELGANCTCLIAPYLAYMRQDKRFHPGEGITSTYFAELVSGFADTLITIDPHLHRRSSLEEIYTIPASVIHAADVIASWIKDQVEKPVLIGPDGESEQWVAEVAKRAEAPFTVLEKIRLGDRQVEVSIPELSDFALHTPVLVDDIISTARTMIETIGHLKRLGMQAPVCIGVHPIFADGAYANLLAAGAGRVVTCNSIYHKSNDIDISHLLTSF